jgi:hypothetical protein
MGPTDAELQRRRAELAARERRVAARESELHARRSWRRLWWAVRLAPWGLVELVLASWLVVAAVALSAGTVRVSGAICGSLVGALAVARLCGATAPPDDRREG